MNAPSLPLSFFALSGIFILGVIGIFVDPVATTDTLIALLPISALLAVVAVIYMAAIYAGLDEPRSQFFKMLLGAMTVKTAAAIVIATFVMMGLGALPQLWNEDQRRGLVALTVLVLMLPPVIYALTIAVGRWRAAKIG